MSLNGSQRAPEKFKKDTAPNTAATNRVHRGWNVTVDRLFVANGKRDPWRESTLSSDYIKQRSSSTQPTIQAGLAGKDLTAEFTALGRGLSSLSLLISATQFHN